MEKMRTFKSASNDTSFPWKVFIATFALHLVSSNLWALTGNKSLTVFTLINIGSVLPGFLLAKFIQHLKTAGARPPISVATKGLYIQPTFGSLIYIPWSDVDCVCITETRDNKGKTHLSIQIETSGKRRKYWIVEEQLADDLNDLSSFIEQYHPVIKQLQPVK